MVHAAQNDIAGSAVFWTLGESTDFAKLSAALIENGFGKFQPERMTEAAALKLALERTFPKHEVFAVKDARNSFEVVRIARDSDDKRNIYEHVLTATLNEWQRVTTDSYAEGAMIQAEQLTEDWKTLRNSIPYHSLSRAIVSIVMSLNGTALRPTGGIYWIPNAQWERWELVAQAIELASPTHNKVFGLRTLLDEHSGAVIREALQMEIRREARSIDETLHNPETGLRAAGTAKRRANDLRNKIAAYEQAFSMALPDLKRALDEATGQEARATLMDIASEGPLLLFQN